ncbi:hypothetical protein HY406_00210 [Candidatus Giovannonibacteria bacterium]|nr:hypothetical protein [Candidatus Giovannonibacteria bacterium]
MSVPKNLSRRTESWRNSLLEKYTWFVALYCVYLKGLDAFIHRKERRKNWQRGRDLTALADRKLGDLYHLTNRVSARLNRNRFYHFPLLPNKFLAKERTFRGTKIKLIHFPWHIIINKHEEWGFWQDMNIRLGKLLEVAIRWDGGRRRYVAMRLWLVPYKYFYQPHPDHYGKFEACHEIWEIENRYPVSRWWWGYGWFRAACHRGNLFALYHHFGYLFRWTRNGCRQGFLGKELTVKEKERVLEEYKRRLKVWGREDAQMYLDAITGYSRNLEKEYYWACCIDCHILMRPDTSYGTEEYLRCDKCRERHEKELDAQFAA